MIDTSNELTLGIELPVACTTIAGNAEEGKHYVINRKQILEYHSKTSKIDLGDAKFDEHRNYAFSRSHGAIPIIDYNPRNEKLTSVSLKERGYDQTRKHGRNHRLFEKWHDQAARHKQQIIKHK